MQRLGITKYHLEHILLSGTNNQRQNEFLFLINETLPINTKIESDSEFIYKQTIAGITSKYFQLNYFTGNISLTTVNGGVTEGKAEFMRVIPDIEN